MESSDRVVVEVNDLIVPGDHDEWPDLCPFMF